MMFFVLACIFVAASAQVPPDAVGGHNMTHHGNGTHHHHEATESEFWTFNYEPHTGYMVVLKDTDCYIWRITDGERKVIHTDVGLRNVEIRVVGEIDNAVYTVLDSKVLHPNIVRGCGKHALKFYIVH